jgi:hypothetical protein
MLPGTPAEQPPATTTATQFPASAGPLGGLPAYAPIAAAQQHGLTFGSMQGTNPAAPQVRPVRGCFGARVCVCVCVCVCVLGTPRPPRCRGRLMRGAALVRCWLCAAVPPLCRRLMCSQRSSSNNNSSSNSSRPARWRPWRRGPSRWGWACLARQRLWRHSRCPRASSSPQAARARLAWWRTRARTTRRQRLRAASSRQRSTRITARAARSSGRPAYSNARAATARTPSSAITTTTT